MERAAASMWEAQVRVDTAWRNLSALGLLETVEEEL